MVQGGHFYKKVAQPLFGNEIAGAVQGFLSFWAEFQETRLGQMIPGEIRGVISKIMNDLGQEMAKPMPFQDIYAL